MVGRIDLICSEAKLRISAFKQLFHDTEGPLPTTFTFGTDNDDISYVEGPRFTYISLLKSLKIHNNIKTMQNILLRILGRIFLRETYGSIATRMGFH